MKTVEIDIGANTFIATQAWRIDGHELVAVQIEQYVDAVARRAGHFAYDLRFSPSQRVDEGTLANVASSTIVDFHSGWFDVFVFVIAFGQTSQNLIEQLLPVAVCNTLTGINQPRPNL